MGTCLKAWPIKWQAVDMSCFYNEMREEKVLSCCLSLQMMFLLLHLVYTRGFWSVSFGQEAKVHPGQSLGQRRTKIQRPSLTLTFTPNVSLKQPIQLSQKFMSFSLWEKTGVSGRTSCCELTDNTGPQRLTTLLSNSDWSSKVDLK